MISRMTAVVLAAFITHVAVGGDATSPQEQRTLTATADEAMRSGDFAAAITALEELVADTTASTSRDLYNLGVARYRQGDFDGAAEAFGAIDDRLAPEDLRAAAAYNKGTAVYQHVMESLGDTDTSASSLEEGISGIDDAMESLESGLEEYRRSLAFDPTDGDAAANAQMTWEAITQLESLKKQLEEQQDQQEQQQQDQQQDQQEQGQQEQGQQQQGSQGETSPPQAGDPGDAQQQEASPPPEDAADQEQEDLKSLLERAQQAREQLEEHLESHPEDEQAQSQLEAIDEAIKQLQRIQEETNDDTTSGEGEDAQDRPSIEDLETEDEGLGAAETETPANDHDMSQEEARRLLQGVRDREHARRDDLAARQRAHQLPVERDW